MIAPDCRLAWPSLTGVATTSHGAADSSGFSHPAGQVPPAGKRSLAPLASTKVAATVLSSSITRVQVALVPAQSAPQPANDQSGPGVAVSSTAASRSKLAAQVAPQSMPAGVLVTVPSPAVWTASWARSASAVNRRRLGEPRTISVKAPAVALVVTKVAMSVGVAPGLSCR